MSKEYIEREAAINKFSDHLPIGRSIRQSIAEEIFTKLYAHIKYDGHTVSVWKNDLISIAKQYGVDLDCDVKMDGGNK